MSNLSIKKIIINLRNEQFIKYTNESINYKIYNQFKELSIKDIKKQKELAIYSLKNYQFINFNFKINFCLLKNEQLKNHRLLPSFLPIVLPLPPFLQRLLVITMTTELCQYTKINDKG